MGCCTKIGLLGMPWSACCKKDENLDDVIPVFEKELGLGMTLYFRLTSFLALMFLVFTIVSLPVYILYA
jgi:hypothetical protein